MSNASTCTLWKRAEPKSGTHAHVLEVSVKDPGLGITASTSEGRWRAPKHRANELSDRGACNRNGSMGMNGSSREWTRPRGEKRPKNARRGNTAREGEGERVGEPVRERACDSMLSFRA